MAKSEITLPSLNLRFAAVCGASLHPDLLLLHSKSSPPPLLMLSSLISFRPALFVVAQGSFSANIQTVIRRPQEVDGPRRGQDQDHAHELQSARTGGEKHETPHEREDGAHKLHCRNLPKIGWSGFREAHSNKDLCCIGCHPDSAEVAPGWSIVQRWKRQHVQREAHDDRTSQTHNHEEVDDEVILHFLQLLQGNIDQTRDHGCDRSAAIGPKWGTGVMLPRLNDEQQTTEANTHAYGYRQS
mmetsp:Transcript_31178/g.67085  ORF Transcript_31178/g.67085 Transcript_31178/m.67085 type:complete len:242 (+) Transcript_31178:520-1245(+)